MGKGEQRRAKPARTYSKSLAHLVVDVDIAQTARAEALQSVTGHCREDTVLLLAENDNAGPQGDGGRG